MKRERKTVCFTDLSNFAVLWKALGDEKGIVFLQETYEFAGDIILEYGGIIHKYLGDAILFSFPSPQQAIQAVQKLASKQWNIDNIGVAFYTGVATGDVFVGPVGHPSYLVEDIIGQTVNQAGQLLKSARENPNRASYCETTLKALQS